MKKIKQHWLIIKENWLILSVLSISFVINTMNRGYESMGIQKADAAADLAAAAGATAIAKAWWEANKTDVIVTVVGWFY